MNYQSSEERERYERNLSIRGEQKRRMTMKRKSVRIFGKSVPVWLIAVFATFIIAAAALAIIQSWQFSGSVASVENPPEPQSGTEWTNDDGFIYNGARDEGDDGMDPSQIWQVGGIVTRQSYDLQNCTISVSGTDVIVVMDDAHETTYCATGVEFQNNSGMDLALDGVAVVGAPIEADLAAFSPRCYTILDTTLGSVGVDLYPIVAAPPGSFSGATLDFTWAVPSTIGCP